MKYKDKIIDISSTIFILIIFLILPVTASIFASNWKVNKMTEGIEVCVELDNTSVVYFECLEQNDLSSWDINNKESALKKEFWVNFIWLLIMLFILEILLFDLITGVF
jgi:hypothetical protein